MVIWICEIYKTSNYITIMNEKNQEFEPNQSTVVYSRNTESDFGQMVNLFEIPGSRFLSGRILAIKAALNMGIETFNIK